MAKYNVFVPARKGSDMPDLSIKVEASNWLVALKESLRQIGEQGDSLANIVCETASDGSLRVADPGSKRVFVIRQTQEATADDDAMVQEAERRAAESRRLAEMAEKAKDETELRLKDVETRMTAHAMPAIQVPKDAEPAAVESAAAEAARKLEEEKARLEEELAEARAKLEEAARKAADEATGVLGTVEVEERKKPAPADKPATKAAAPAAETGDEWDDLDDWYDGVEEEEETIDGIMGDIFLATDDLHERPEAEAARIVLELANKYVSAEAASIFYSQMNSALKDLRIVAASGPVAKKIEGAAVPLGKGIVGFSVVNGVKITVNQVQQNPNFYGKLDQEFGFQTRSILCVPIQFEDRTYGAIELINKQGDGGQWSSNDGNILQSLGMILGRAVETQIAARKE